MSGAARARKKKPVYSAHPSLGMVQGMMAKLKERTGKTLDEWVREVIASGPPTEKERRVWLKERHQLGTNYAWWVAERAEGKGAEHDSPEAYLKAAEGWVEAMFAGPRAGLRPVYERLLELGFALGKEVKACPCQTIVPLYRNHVFAQVKPATRTRIDFGLALGATKAAGRLIDTGGYAKKDRITHRIPVTCVEEIDAEVEAWLHEAYEMDA
jgi:hypothetical protein